MYNKDSFKEDFEKWESNLSKRGVRFGHFDSSIKVLFLERDEDFEDEEALDELRETLREEDDDVRVSTYTMPDSNKIREEF